MEMANKKKRLALEDVSNEYDTQKNIGGNKRAKCPSIVQPSLKLPNKLVKPIKTTTTTTTVAVRPKKREAVILGTKKPAVEKQQSATKRRKSCNVDNLVNPIERLTVNLGYKVDESNVAAGVAVATAAAGVAVATAATRRKATAARKTSTTSTAATKTAASNQQQQQQQHPSTKPFNEPIHAEIDSLISSSSPLADHNNDEGDVEIVCVQSSAQLQDIQEQQQHQQQQHQQQQQQQQAWVDVDVGTSIYYLPNYVNDIFDYYRDREVKFRIPDYMFQQTDLTPSMRAILVDWLVEVQQSFELNHETLYMAVKLIDIFSSKVTIKRNKLQLIGAVALNLACKFEERCPPMLDDFVYVCTCLPPTEFLKMEDLVFQAVGFDIGLPLSYTFLRRFATCVGANLKTLTLSRFLLESSLMDYQFVVCLDSILACACLFIAMCMNQDGSWDDTIYHYTQYRPVDFEEVVYKLNDMICNPPEPSLTTILSKYSHPVFLEVAKIDKLTNEQLRAVVHSL
uniref:Cyclin B3 n=1 Tax=Helobdella triserialis TaxID=6413 RepID=Q25168_HELTR|nr:cyclin B3 [Helobdella triserialis]